MTIKRTTLFFENERGVAAVEFALLLPVLLTLVLGVYELSRYILLNQKIERVAYTVADVVTQQTVTTKAELNDILKAAAKIMDPYEFDEDGLVIITSVYQDPKKGPLIRWQYKGGGTLDRDSKIGKPGVNGSVATLPDAFDLNDTDNIIISEVFYNYIAGITEDYLSSRENYKFAIFKPRFGALTTAPN